MIPKTLRKGIELELYELYGHAFAEGDMGNCLGNKSIIKATDSILSLIREALPKKLKEVSTWSNDMKYAYNKALSDITRLLGGEV